MTTNSFISARVKKWIPIKDFLTEASKLSNKDITMKQIYKRIQQRHWHDGFVVKKNPNTNRYAFGCLEDYKQWLGLI